MRAKTLFVVSVFMLCISALAPAQSKLQLKVITSSPEGFWVNATLVYGEKDAVLIDAQFLLSDAHRLAAAILESKKNLTTIYATHFHPDHYFGLTVLKQAFPNARIVALPSTIAGIKKTWEGKVKQPVEKTFHKKPGESRHQNGKEPFFSGRLQIKKD